MDDCVSYLQRMTTCSATCVDVYIQYCQPNQIYIVCDVRDTCGATQPYYMLSTIVYYVTLKCDGTLYKHGQIECVYVLHTYVNVNKNNYSSDWDYRRKKCSMFVCTMSLYIPHSIDYTTSCRDAATLCRWTTATLLVDALMDSTMLPNDDRGQTGTAWRTTTQCRGCTNCRVKICWPDEEHTMHVYVWYSVYAQQCEVSVAHAAGDSLKQSLSMLYWLLCLIACCSWCCVMRTSMTSRCVTNVCMCLSSLWKMVYHIACHSVRYCGFGGVGSVRDNRCAHCCVSGRSLLKYVSTCCWYCTV